MKLDERKRIKIRKGLYLVSRNGIWHGEESRLGVQRRWTLDTSDVDVATNRLLESAATRTQQPVKQGSPKAVPHILSRIFEEYQKWFQANKRSARTALPRIEDFLDFVGDETDIRAITRTHIQSWLDSHPHYAPATTQGDFARVRAFLRWFERNHPRTIDLDAIRGIDLPKDDGIAPEPPHLESVRAVIRALAEVPWLKAYVSVLVETGMRPSELLAVRGVDLQNDDFLMIQPWEKWSPKNKYSRRMIKLNSVAASILSERKRTLFDPSLPMFATERGQMRTESAVANRVRRMKPKDASMTLYGCRHLFCTIHAQPGPEHMDIHALATYIGHSPHSTYMLMRYYVHADALRRGAPPSLLGEPKEGKLLDGNNQFRQAAEG